MIIVAGTVRIPQEKFAQLIDVAQATMAATRREAGCLVYSFSRDLGDPGLLRIYEEWESRTHLDAHLKQPHMPPWRAKLAELGATDRSVKIFETSGGTPL
jgi:quinol monooxygenase YgiN